MKDPASHLNRYAVERFQTYGAWPGSQSVHGCQLEPGDVVEATDVYDSTSGNWEPCPVPGSTLQPGLTVTWVRPLP